MTLPIFKKVLNYALLKKEAKMAAFIIAMVEKGQWKLPMLVAEDATEQGALKKFNERSEVNEAEEAFMIVGEKRPITLRKVASLKG